MKDRQGWLKWLYEAKLRYGLLIFNYIVTSNHVHLLVFDDSGYNVIPKSMQLIAGRTGQEYNQRKKRKGAFWEDRYHATAVESEDHLLRCLIYIDLNMVRAGVISHPSEWPFSGYHEIRSPQRKFAYIAYQKLAEKAGFPSYELFKEAHGELINEALSIGHQTRQREWTESIAVGSKMFTQRIKEELGICGKGRAPVETGSGVYQLREGITKYGDDFSTEADCIDPPNVYFWDIC